MRSVCAIPDRLPCVADAERVASTCGRWERAVLSKVLLLEHLLHMASTAHRKRGLSEAITSFPDELLCQVLKRLDLTTKLQAHTVCRQWNSILSAPCCADLWTVVPLKTMAGIKLKTQCQGGIEQYTQWLAARATGIPRANIITERWTSSEPDSSVYTEARFFVEQQLPLLLGYLHHYTKQLDIALTAGEPRCGMCVVSLCQTSDEE